MAIKAQPLDTETLALRNRTVSSESSLI